MKAKKRTSESWEKLVPQKKSMVLAKKNPDESLSVLHMDKDDRFFLIEKIAAEAFLLIDGKRNIGQIVKKIQAGCKAPEEKLRHDMKKYFTWLKKEDLVGNL